MHTQYDVTKAIQERRSVRTYDASRPVTDESLIKIQQYISTLASPFDADGIKIIVVRKDLASNGEKLGTYGVIKGANVFLAMAVDKDPLTWVAAGYEFEDLLLYITSLGLGTVWLGGTFRREAFANSANLPQGMILPIVSPVGYADRPRLTERLMRKMVKGDSRKPWDVMFFDGAVGTPLTPEAAGKFAQPLEMLRLAPSATNSQPWRVIRVDGQWHFYADFKANISETERIMKHMDLGIAICHFDLVRQSLALPGKIMVDNPSLPVPDTYHYIASFA